jgi:hypothetical protein
VPAPFGTRVAGEDDSGTPWHRRFYLDRRVRPVLGDQRLVGKPRSGAQPGLSPPTGYAAGSAAAVHAGLPGCRAETRRALSRAPQRPLLWAGRSLPGHQEARLQAQEEAVQGRLTGHSRHHHPPARSTASPACPRVKSQAKADACGVRGDRVNASTARPSRPSSPRPTGRHRWRVWPRATTLGRLGQEISEAEAMVDIIHHSHATRWHGRAGRLQLETHVASGVQAVMDKEMELPELRR